MADAKRTLAHFDEKKVEHIPRQVLQKRSSSGPSPHTLAKKRQCQNEPSQCVENKDVSLVAKQTSSTTAPAKDEETHSNTNCSDTCNTTAVTKRKKCKAKRRSHLLLQSKDAKALAQTNRTEEDMEIEYSVVVNEVSDGDSYVCIYYEPCHVVIN